MAWTTPGTAVAGDVLTAAFWNSNVRDNMLMGQPVFTNEAARDAAITSPVEGQIVYLTSPTVPAATGGTTFIPSGITTIYNGSVWVCSTPISAFTQNAGSVTGTTYTTTLTGSPGTNPTVTLVTGTSALIMFSALITGGNSGGVSMSVSVSGAGTVAGNDDYRTYHESATYLSMQLIAVISGLTAGTNTFAICYRMGGGTGTFQTRRITVSGVV
jgi:hypothetical protein